MLYRTSFGVPEWRLRSPFGDLERMRNQLGSLFDALSGEPGAAIGAGVFPAVNITETQDNYFVRAELPGVKNDELQLTDAIMEQAKQGNVLAYKFKGKRFDCGSVNGFVDAINYFFKKLNCF